jgi:hypothetical protein
MTKLRYANPPVDRSATLPNQFKKSKAPTEKQKKQIRQKKLDSMDNRISMTRDELVQKRLREERAYLVANPDRLIKSFKIIEPKTPKA